MIKPLKRLVKTYRFEDGTSTLQTLEEALAAELICPLWDAGVPENKAYDVAKQIVAQFSELAAGAWLQSLDLTKTDLALTAGAVLIEEYTKQPFGYRIQAAKRLGCSVPRLRTVITDLHAYGQLGGKLLPEISTRINAGAKSCEVTLDVSGVQLVATRLAVYRVWGGELRAKQERARRKALSELDRITLVEQSGMEALILTKSAAGMSAYAIEKEGLTGFDRKTIKTVIKSGQTL